MKKQNQISINNRRSTFILLVFLLLSQNVFSQEQENVIEGNVLADSVIFVGEDTNEGEKVINNAIFDVCTEKSLLNLPSGEDDKKNSSKVRPAQLSFIYPLGTNGIESPHYANHFSLNLFAGLNGGVQGAEISGFLNMNTQKVMGAQVAGFMNFNKDSLVGAQIGGFTNLNVRSVHGVQIGGFLNQSWGNVRGGQIAGFMNMANKVEGFQVAGFLNLAKSLNGVQLGFINVVDSVEKGVPIGFLSFVRKNGYRKFQLGINEVFYADSRFMIGTEQFYNILALGAQPKNNQFTWAFGYGVGTLRNLGKNKKIGLEGITYHLNKGEVFTNKLNLLTKISAPLILPLSGNMNWVIAPSYNILVSEPVKQDGMLSASDIAPYTFYDHISNKHNRQRQVQMWIGLDLGVRF